MTGCLGLDKSGSNLMILLMAEIRRSPPGMYETL